MRRFLLVFFIVSLVMLFLSSCASTGPVTQFEEKCFTTTTPPYQRCYSVPVDREIRDYGHPPK